ncbi:Bifunctional protein FolD [Clarias magur]|uniref:Bifunctional protein FolD n=1 Tax=Clarias magur TaxID=1594786 RepID=A0A8J4V2R3_CLAMG|nr:Bifunctional protein FolD [Clarias magur]
MLNTKEWCISPAYIMLSGDFLFHEIGPRCSDRSVRANSVSRSRSGGNRVQ